jgi:Family of unknown function (DUF6069)
VSGQALGPVTAGGRPDLARVAGAGAFAVVLATLANLVVAGVARAVLKVPGHFLPLAPGPVSFLTLAAGTAGVGVFVLLVLFTARPLRWFRLTVVTVALISTLSPLGLLLDRSRVPSTSGRAVAAAVLLHLVAGTVILWLLTTRSGVRAKAGSRPDRQA